MAKRIFLIIPILGMLATLGCLKHEEVVRGRYWFIIENIEFEKDENPEILLWVALPQEHRGQRVKIEKISPVQKEVIEDEINGNKIVFWKLENPTVKDGRLIFFIDFEIKAEEVQVNVDPEEIEEYDKDSFEYKFFTKSEKWIEITDEIKSKTDEITAGETNPYLKAKLIYDWILRNMVYEYPEISKRGASKSFQTLKGDCGEFSVLFCSMCRSVGIPARTVTCIWQTGAGHQWAEFFLPPYGWIPVDASVGQMLLPDQKTLSEQNLEKFLEKIKASERTADYFFGNLYPGNRVIVSIGTNIKVISGQTGIEREFLLMQPGGLNAYPPSIELNGFSDKTVYNGFYIFGESRNNYGKAFHIMEIQSARKYLTLGDYEKAESGIKKGLEENPNSPDLLLLLGQVYMNTGRTDEAIESFKKGLSAEGGSIKPIIDVWVHNLLGVCYIQKDQPDLAREEFEIVIESGIDYNDSQQFAAEKLKELDKKEPGKKNGD